MRNMRYVSFEEKERPAEEAERCCGDYTTADGKRRKSFAFSGRTLSFPRTVLSYADYMKHDLLHKMFLRRKPGNVCIFRK